MKHPSKQKAVGALLREVNAVYGSKQASALLDISPSTFRRWVRGETAPKDQIQPKLEQILMNYRAGENADFRFIDLFCGIGGFRIAFERAGGKCVFSSDWDKYARQTYTANHGEEPYGDIHSIDVSAIPAHDILCAGFPCQPFSIAGVSKKISLGRNHGFDDEKQGNLFFDIVNILHHHRPASFVLENVKNLLRHDKGRTFDIIHNTLTETLGYSVSYKVIDAQAVVPQHRERIYIVGFRDHRRFTFPVFPTKGPTLSTVLDRDVPAKYTLSDHLWRYLQNYAKKHRDAGNGFGFGLFTGSDVARTLSARYHKDGSEILISQGTNKNPRRLTPTECRRLMGFPGDFVIPVSVTQAYRQFGNSIVVPVIKAIALEVAKSLNPTPSRPSGQYLIVEPGDHKSSLCDTPSAKTHYRIKSRRRTRA